jgi:hypothetical protein
MPIFMDIHPDPGDATEEDIKAVEDPVRLYEVAYG